MPDTDIQWKRFGEVDPYFGVLSDERFHKEQLNSERIAEFFRSGEEHIDLMFSIIRSKLSTHFSPRRALDFGCGVGRLLSPLASRSNVVVGYDISPGMLVEARKNCGAPNISLSSTIEGDYDFIHSVFVFQHIAPKRGEQILTDLLQHLRGIGALHFTYASRLSSPFGAFVRFLRRTSPIPLSGLYNLAKGRPFSYPWVIVSTYSLNRLFDIFLENGCHDIHIVPADSSPIAGCIFFFKR